MAGSLAIASASHAQDNDPHTVGWNVVAGGGLAVMPTYEGSDKSRTIPTPFVRAVYDDMLSIGVDGVNAYWRLDGFRVGAGLTFNGGRKDHESNGIIQSGDDRLRGMGDISAAPGFKIFVADDIYGVNVSSAVTKFSGTDNKGVVANIGAGVPFKLSQDLTVTAHVDATWANRDYMQTFFGVTATQSANSGFSQFTPKSGLKDAEFGVRAEYRLDPHWFISANVGVKRLEGDAAKSPLIASKSQAVFMSVLGYRF
nr:MipA/OmpV family protein [Duganella guangzhouensis]